MNQYSYLHSINSNHLLINFNKTNTLGYILINDVISYIMY